MPTPSICVVINCYNEGQRLTRALNSVLAQTDRDFRFLVVNDASPDPVTNDICREFEARGDGEVLWRPSNGGLSAARNDAFAQAREDLLVFLDGDDELPPVTVARVRDTFVRHPEADFVYVDYTLINAETGVSKVVRCDRFTDSRGYLDAATLADDWFMIGTCPCRREVWARAGGYRLEFSHGHQDFDFWMRAIVAGCLGLYCPEVLYTYHRSQHGMNATAGSHGAISAWRANTTFLSHFGTSRRVFVRLLEAHAFRDLRRFAWRNLLAGRLWTPRVLACALTPPGVLGAYFALRAAMAAPGPCKQTRTERE